MASSNFPHFLQVTKEEEDQYRAQFAQQSQSQSSSYSSNKYLHLIDVFSEVNTFTRERETQQEKDVPHLLLPLLGEGEVPVSFGSRIIADEPLFNQRWSQFSGGILSGLDWSNVFAAGGAVLRCADLGDTSPLPLSESGSDIDLFVYGLSNSQAQEKVTEIYSVFKRNVNSQTEIVRTKNAITMIASYPFRHVQVILRMYKSPAEVLMGFDIDSCTIGYDGSKVWALPRCKRALTKRYNVVDLSRRSLTYETRLFKYSKRGFSVLVPGYRPNEVDSNLYNENRPLKEVSGLARLLLLDHRRSVSVPEHIQKPKSLSGVRTDPFIADRVLDGQAKDDEGEGEDYILVFVPFGPQWQLFRTVNILKARDRSQYYARKQKDYNDHSHVLVLGMEGILHGTANWCNECAKGTSTSPNHGGKDDCVRGGLSWMRENPGRQGDSNLLTGSFHPLSAADWETDSNKHYGGQRGQVPPRPKPRPISEPKTTMKKIKMKKTFATKTMKKFPKKKPMKAAPKRAPKKAVPKTKSKAMTKPKYSQFNQPIGFGQPQNTGFGQPMMSAAPGFGGSVFGGGTLISGGFAQTPGFGASQNTGFGAPQNAGFGAPQNTGFGAPQNISSLGAGGGFGASGSVPDQHKDLLKQYKDASPKESDAKILLLLSLLTKKGLLQASDRSKLKDKVIQGDPNLICAVEVFEIDFDFLEVADTFMQIASL